MMNFKDYNEFVSENVINETVIDGALVTLCVIWLLQGKFAVKNMKQNLDMMLQDFSSFLSYYGYHIDYEIGKTMLSDLIDKASDKIEKLKLR